MTKIFIEARNENTPEHHFLQTIINKFFPEKKKDVSFVHLDGIGNLFKEAAARKDLHPIFFECFNDYEICVSNTKDESGKPQYNIPNLKSKLHTYMLAQKLSRKYRDRFGNGDWLFDNKDYWDLDIEAHKRFLER
ncbi:MAG: hypothetical protein IJZ87_06925 [Bacteroidales bacterium]|nr:hypothetical protein [Bacteroidales bacterium]